ncbi:hypothetical protein KSP35_20510 [Aquihabitans sp. G128]|uniref:thrombospondin type-1 domain-containing protein n=1 Tax=Aquihabitans sp. G128 TaxID=2849779 RepID=UPI001C24FAEB|nr:thrombospondin type-1 domain-containing protein [Aquihabitans sp. G128]QXC60676.1 hypothetical protein KSP35_20510 [Aquihabitans sp. G128]
MAAFDGGQQVDGLLVEEIAGEVLVVNSATNEAHALRGASAAVFALCDGATTRAEMATLVAVQTGLPVDPEIVDLALAELVDAGIVTPAAAQPQTTRRQVLHKLGLVAGAAAALPLIETITMQPAAAAASGPPVTSPPTGNDVDCQYRVEYGPCSVGCGGGTMQGTVIVQVPASGNGAPCPSGPFTLACAEQPCPVQCQFHFEQGPCNDGMMTITQVIDAPAQFGGGCPTIPPITVPC